VSLQLRVAAIAGLAVAAAVFAGVGVSYLVLRAQLRVEAERGLRESTGTLASVASREAAAGRQRDRAAILRHEAEEHFGDSDVRVQLSPPAERRPGSATTLPFPSGLVRRSPEAGGRARRRGRGRRRAPPRADGRARGRRGGPGGPPPRRHRSFNATLEALERAIEAQRRLVADASHELRTPIASLRANLQVLEDADRLDPDDREALRADIIEQLDQLSALVGDLVELARGTLSPEDADDVRLDLVVASLGHRLRRRGADVDVGLDLEATVVVGQPEQISRAVSNLLANARKWSPRAGEVEVSLREGVLSVRDHGPGFATAASLRPLLPRGRGARHAGLGPGTGDRQADGRRTRGQRDGDQRAGRAGRCSGCTSDRRSPPPVSSAAL
jgi:signal transduction histidine kinase